MIGSTARHIAIGALALTGIIHLILAPEYMGEQAYIGLLFIAGGLSTIALAAWLWLRDQAVAWLAAAVICAGMAIGFVLSRTIGLPGFHEAEWELSGVISVLLELTVIGIAIRPLSLQEA
ncbi:MAG: hypothetical protein J0H98_06505 [Solirubrobacterales bacterium]|nr:hypothetical protein [Solirubrobacterales bacterium]